MMTAPTLSRKSLFSSSFAAVLFVFAAATSFAGLDDYVQAADESYSWELQKNHVVKVTHPYTFYTIGMVSQTWRGDEWEHRLSLVKPETVANPDSVLLIIGGGVNAETGEPKGASATESLIVSSIANRTHSLVALVSQVPNQPILGGLHEDAAIAKSFDEYLKTGEEDWPMLFPMVKTAVRAMDAIQEFSKEQLGYEVERFVLAGGSKRGWTTWLTAAADSRVVAIAPIVIDNLNIPAQMDGQLAAWGKYSVMVKDYTEMGLQDRMGGDDTAGQKLVDMIDPYAYLERLTMPKLIQSSTNDPYWVVDAIGNYFHDLKGENYIHYSPNTGHDIDQGAIETVTGFYRLISSGRDLPKFGWEFESLEGRTSLQISAQDRPSEVRIWSTNSTDRDFRNDVWNYIVVDAGEFGEYEITVNEPGRGYTAFYAELMYPVDEEISAGLCTEVKVLGAGHE